MTGKIRVLVVEDEGVVAMNLKMLLLKNAYDVMPIAISGETALTLTSQYHPNIVLMDIRLHGDMDGIDTASLISSHYQIPIIYTSAMNDDDTLERANKTPHVGFLIKPYNEQALLDMIEEGVRERRQQSK